MGKTKTAHSSAFLGAEFNTFLFEPIGVDICGRPVTVVSALARLDMDPWAEADRLSRLPDQTAAHSVSMVLSRLPEIVSGMADRQKSAARLVQLLPNRLLPGPVRRPFAGIGLKRGVPLTLTAGLVCVAAALLLGQILWQSDHAAVAAPQPAAAQGPPAPHSQAED